jgi:hypothetical protein
MQSKALTPMEATMYNHGGILIDHGWIRVIGAGSKKLVRNIPEWNKGKSFARYGEEPAFLLIAEDVIGGFFALNRGGISDKDYNKVFYFGPNSLVWQPMRLDYSQFIYFCFSSRMNEFYEDFRWKGWEEEVKALPTTSIISSYPLLWTLEGRELKKNRKPVPVQFLWEQYQEHQSMASLREKSNLATNESDTRKKPAPKKTQGK